MNDRQRLGQTPTHLLDKLSLLRQLKTDKLGRQTRIIARTDSTQNEAATWVRQGAKDGAVVIAEEQTMGRGRQGKGWCSPAGKGIWMSLVLRPAVPLRLIPRLTLLLAVALCAAIRRVTGIKPGIKWPNDIWIRNKKVCGILLESATNSGRTIYILAGIGINVNLDKNDFSSELQEIATSLKIESGKEVDRTALIAECLYEIELHYELYMEQGFTPIRILWEAQNITMGRHVTVITPSGAVAGIAQRLDESGALILIGNDGCHRKIFSGDMYFTK